MDKIELTFFQKNLDKLTIQDNKKLLSIVTWLENILTNSDYTGKLLMPKKSELAKILHVGLGTIQNAYRILEDKGLLISKQCVGTFYVTDKSQNFRKLTSKKDILINSILTYFLNKEFKINDKIPSIRYFSNKFNASTATILQVFETLEQENILENLDGTRRIKSLDFENKKLSTKETLSDKVYKDLKEYISNNLKQGDKLSSVSNLAKEFSTSEKTVYSAIQKLQKEGILKALSGRYGTVILRIPNDKVFYQKPEISIFASSSKTYYYRYEKILNIIKKMIIDNFEVGSKLPSISELALLLDVNSNTIRKTFDVLREEGIVSSVRGRYGGTFVLELPDLESTQIYQWLAVTNDFSV